MIDYDGLRRQMVSEQIKARGIADEKILAAFGRVLRHLFVEPDQRGLAYQDHPLPIGEGQTISQPYMAALMTSLLELKPGKKVLEIGTGSGYQAAILAELGAIVYSIERVPGLAERAGQVLESLGYKVNIRLGNGVNGWEDAALFDRIIVTAASEKMPQALLDQLAAGGIAVAPLGSLFAQELVVFRKTAQNNIETEKHGGCIFVPLIGAENEH